MPSPEEDDLDDDRTAPSPRRRRGPDDDLDRLPRRKSGNKSVWIILLIVGLCVMICGTPIFIGLLLPAVQKIRESANRMKSSNNLKQIDLALMDYETKNNELPNNSYGPDGKPLLSWRVHILPYLGTDEAALYQQFKLDEPWDSPNNIRLLDKMPKVYLAPSASRTGSETKTVYRGFSSSGAVFEHKPGDGQKRGPTNRLTIAQFKDPTSETALIVEAADAVEWTKPDDLNAPVGKPFPPMGNYYRSNVFLVVFANGQVRVLKTNLPETTLRALITHSGGETLATGWDQ